MKIWILGAMLALGTPLSANPPAAATLESGLAAYLAGDYGAARQQFLTLANHGSAIGETMLGTMYARGQGVAADPASAAAFWFRAANRSYAPAQLALARALAAGQGIGKDVGAAWMWAQLATIHGDTAIRADAQALADRLQPQLAPAERQQRAHDVRNWRPWPDSGS
jgi:TPR repeat protein